MLCSAQEEPVPQSLIITFNGSTTCGLGLLVSVLLGGWDPLCATEGTVSPRHCSRPRPPPTPDPPRPPSLVWPWKEDLFPEAWWLLAKHQGVFLQLMLKRGRIWFPNSCVGGVERALGPNHIFSSLLEEI